MTQPEQASTTLARNHNNDSKNYAKRNERMFAPIMFDPYQSICNKQVPHP